MSLEGKSRANRPLFAKRDRIKVTKGRFSGRFGLVLQRTKVEGEHAYDVRLDGMSDMLLFAEADLEYVRAGAY